MRFQEAKPTEAFPRGRATGTYKSYMENNRIIKILRKAKHPVEMYTPKNWQLKKKQEKSGQYTSNS